MNVFGQAMLLMGYGLGAVFAALLIFYGMIVLITKCFPAKAEAED